MSRYTNTVGTRTYAWGFDRVVGYFVSCYDDSLPEDEETIFDCSSTHSLKPKSAHVSCYTNSEILTIMEEINTDHGEEVIPRRHRESIAMDLPF